MSRLRKTTSEDWDNIKDFFNRNPVGGHIDLFEFNKYWFNISNSKEWNIYIIEESDSIIRGLMMIIEAPLLLFGNNYKIGWISTGLVEDFSRSSTFGAQLYLKIYREYKIVGALSGNKHSLPINSFLGESILGLSMVRYLFINSEDVLELCNTKEDIKISDRSKISHNSNIELFEVNDIPADYSKLWNGIKLNFDIVVNRTDSYLKWRYISSPFLKYKLLDIRLDNKIIALAVVREQNTYAGSVLRVLEIIVGAEYMDDAIKEITQYSFNKKYLFTDFFVIGDYYKESFDRIGYYNSNTHNFVENIPHLLSPVEHRKWTNTFHVGGAMINENIEWSDSKRILFTKGDGDRDWPTNFDIRNIA
jgi:hypothetical protein